MPTATICKRFDFSASHVLDHLPANHPCARLHGHNYGVELELTGLVDARGFVVDYRDLDEFKSYLDGTFDHRHLNDVLTGTAPTAEHLAAHLLSWCAARWPQTAAVRVSETGKTWAEVRLTADAGGSHA